jgi:hypothetical protein
MPLTDADKARLQEEGQRALQILAGYLGPVILSLLSGQPVAWAAVLLPLAGQISRVISPEDMKLLLEEAVAAGKVSWLEAKAIGLWLHRFEVPPEWDPERGTGLVELKIDVPPRGEGGP